MGWAYEGIFEEMPKDQEDLLGSWWRSQPSAIRVGTMGYRTKTVKAGPMLEAEVYPMFGREQEKRARKARENITPEKQSRLNLERAKRYFVQLINTNFGEGDIHLTLTYEQAPSYERARKDLRNFLDKVKRLREKRGLEELKYAGTIEENRDGRKVRIHAHLLMNDGISRDELETIWAKGRTNVLRLQPDESGLEGIARYIVKQQKSRKKWFRSRNLKKPQTRVSDSKISKRRIKILSQGFCAEAKEILEKVYPGYLYVKSQVFYSDFVDGVYIRALMRRVPDEG